MYILFKKVFQLVFISDTSTYMPLQSQGQVREENLTVGSSPVWPTAFQLPSSATLCLEFKLSHTLKIFQLMQFKYLLQCLSRTKHSNPPVKWRIAWIKMHEVSIPSRLPASCSVEASYQLEPGFYRN